MIILVCAGITASGCFSGLSELHNSTTVALVEGNSTLAQSLLNSMGCFVLEFSLASSGQHTMEIGLLREDSACNGSFPVLLKVFQRQSKFRLLCMLPAWLQCSPLCIMLQAAMV